MQENWPGIAPRGGCGCARCRGGAPSLGRGPLGTALAHAQSRRMESAVAEALADLRAEAPAYETVYGDHSVRWERRMSLPAFLKLDDPRYRDPKLQWNYRIYLRDPEKKDPRPLYIGKSGPRAPGVKKGIRDRLMQHARGDGGTRRPTVKTIADAKALAAAHGSARLHGLRGDSKVLADIAKSLPPGSLDVMVGEVVKRRVGPGGKVSFVRADPGASLLTERFQLKSGTARINRRDRAEDDAEAAAELLADEYLF
jgi:hypothetical protein